MSRCRSAELRRRCASGVKSGSRPFGGSTISDVRRVATTVVPRSTKVIVRQSSRQPAAARCGRRLGRSRGCYGRRHVVRLSPLPPRSETPCRPDPVDVPAVSRSNCSRAHDVGSPQGVRGGADPSAGVGWVHPAAGHSDRHTLDTRATTAPGATHDAKNERLI